MPLTCDFHVEDGLAVITIAGRGEGLELVRLVRKLFSGDGVRTAEKRLWDTRGLSYLAMDIQHVQRMSDEANAAIVSAGNATGRTAIVAKPGMHAEVLTLFEYYMRGRPLKVFTTLEAATTWLAGDRER